MSNSELVDMIVREVKKVLSERGIQMSGSENAPIASPAPPAAPITPPAFSGGGQDSTPTTSSVGSTDLTGKQVITQKDLEAFKGQTITVMKNAVITPLAVDYARDKKISINRVEKVAGTTNNPSPAGAVQVTVALAVSPDFTGDPKVLKNILAGKGIAIKESGGGSYEDGIRKVADAVAGGSVSFGLLLENNGMKGPIIANRDSRIRAAHCRDTYDARAARVDIGANVIVLGAASNPEAIIAGFMGY